MYLDRQANSHQEPDQRNIVAKKPRNAIDVESKSNDHGWTDLEKRSLQNPIHFTKGEKKITDWIDFIV